MDLETYRLKSEVYSGDRFKEMEESVEKYKIQIEELENDMDVLIEELNSNKKLYTEIN